MNHGLQTLRRSVCGDTALHYVYDQGGYGGGVGHNHVKLCSHTHVHKPCLASYPGGLYGPFRLKLTYTPRDRHIPVLGLSGVLEVR